MEFLSLKYYFFHFVVVFIFFRFDFISNVCFMFFNLKIIIIIHVLKKHLKNLTCYINFVMCKA
jgi:hypothetical protein